MLAAEHPDLTEILAQRRTAGDTHVILDGTLIHTDRVAATTTKTKGRNAGATVHLWYSGKHRDFGGNIQFLATPDGFPLWCSDVEPGITNDITAARQQGLIGPLSAAAATHNLPTLADKAYHTAGIGIRTPIKKPQGTTHELHHDNRTYNTLH
ncbi:transposase family protein, partial [Amycolatopsis samaneae]|uniref:transposase family protein n=1 Tax=Amycolatopsis samaneae TaxID=664691 RepID=UPI0031EF5F5C